MSEDKDVGVIDFLDQPVADIKLPENLPVGEFLFVVRSYKTEKNQNGNRLVDFVFGLVEVIDADMPEDWDGDVSKGFKRVSDRMWLTEGGAPIMKRWLTDTLGIDDGDSKTFREMFEESVGLAVRVITKREMVGKNKDIEITSVDRYMKAE